MGSDIMTAGTVSAKTGGATPECSAIPIPYRPLCTKIKKTRGPYGMVKVKSTKSNSLYYTTDVNAPFQGVKLASML